MTQRIDLCVFRLNRKQARWFSTGYPRYPHSYPHGSNTLSKVIHLACNEHLHERTRKQTLFDAITRVVSKTKRKQTKTSARAEIF
jgi:hypothetical protein